MHLRPLVVAAVLSGLVSAVDISPQCQNAIVSAFESPNAACLDPAGLVGIFSSGNNSVVPAVNNWLKGTCALDPCTNSSLSAITTTILNGCGSDFGVMSSEIPAIVQAVQKAYPTVRKVICLAHTTGTMNTLCVVEFLNNLESLVGPLTLTEIDNLLNNIDTLPPPPQSLICTNCNKEAYNLFHQELPGTVANLTAPLQAECGASFVDGMVPSDVTETARGAHL